MVWAVDGARVYKIKDPERMRSRRKTYSTKKDAKNALERRGFHTKKRGSKQPRSLRTGRFIKR
jgi:hypothetical protein